MTARHGTRRGVRWRSPAMIAVVTVLTVLAGCGSGALTSTTTVPPTAAGPPVSGDAAPVEASTSSAPPAVTALAAPVATVTASPGFGTAGMAPSQPVTVTVARGVIDTLTMTGPDGAPLAGTVSPDHQTWTLGQHLAFGAAYTVTGIATGAASAVTAGGALLVEASTGDAPPDTGGPAAVGATVDVEVSAPVPQPASTVSTAITAGPRHRNTRRVPRLAVIAGPAGDPAVWAAGRWGRCRRR